MNWQAIDDQMARCGPMLRDEIGLRGVECTELATTMADEIAPHLDAIAVDVATIADIPLRKRFEEMLAFQRYMDWVNGVSDHLGEMRPIVTRMQVLAQSYFGFVYLKDNLLQALRSHVAQTTVTARCCNYLLSPPQVQFRHAVAHGNWCYLDDFSGLEYWARSARGKPNARYVVSDAHLGFWQSLARCVGYVSLQSLHDRDTQQEDGQGR